MQEYQIDFAKPVRPIGKLNGMNNGPLMTFCNRSAEFREMGVDLVRFHETHSPNAKCIEIPFIFPDFDADENDPANYYFGETDAVIRAAWEEGIEMIYRLGMGTEAVHPKIFVTVPKDFRKWARIAMHVMDHYNSGWADGFFYGVRYWELGNECDGFDYWPGPRESYTEFYCTVAPMLKAHDPENRIGPCGWASIFEPVLKDPVQYPPTAWQLESGEKDTGETNDNRIRFYNDFLRRVRDENVPMDFFAWHVYCRDSFRVETFASTVDMLLRKYGFYGRVENINTEWNNVGLSGDRYGKWDFSQLADMKTAAGCVADMIVMQQHGVTKVAYYDADDRSNFNGLYDYENNKLKHFYAMKAIRMLREGRTEVEVSRPQTTAVHVCASCNGKKAVVVAVNEGERQTIRLKMQNLPGRTCTWYLFDDTHDLVPVKREAKADACAQFLLGQNQVVVLEYENNREQS